MADTTKHESITEAVTKTLANHLDASVERLRQTIIGFPSHSKRLRMPSVSISAPAPQFTPKMNPHKRTAIDTDAIEDHKTDVEWIIGDYDFKLQLDLWCGSKEELDDLFDDLFNALNPEIDPMGVRLNMEEYHGLICDYIYVTHTRANSSQSSTKDEWRITLSVMATCNALRVRSEYVIDKTEVYVEAATNIVVEK